MISRSKTQTRSPNSPTPRLADPISEGIRKARRKPREWGTNREVLGIARRLVKEMGITKPSELQAADSGLYSILQRRTLLGEVKFERRQRVWGTDIEVLGIARRFIHGSRITNPFELKKADRGLYAALSERKLLHEVEFEKRQGQRTWGTDGEVDDFARRFMQEKRITKRSELARTDSGLYRVLGKRGLLDQVFAHMETDPGEALVLGAESARD